MRTLDAAELEREVRSRRDREVAESLPLLCLGLSVLYALYAVAHWLLLEPAIARVMLPLAAAASLINLWLAHVSREGGIGRQRPYVTATLVALSVLVNITAHFFLVRVPEQSILFILFLFACGGLVPSIRLAIALGGAAVLTWLALSWDQAGETWTTYRFAMGTAFLLSVVIARVREMQRHRGAREQILREAREEELADALAGERANQRELERLRIVLDAIRRAQTDFVMLGADRCDWDALLQPVLTAVGGRYASLSSVPTNGEPGATATLHALASSSWPQDVREFYREQCRAGLYSSAALGDVGDIERRGGLVVLDEREGLPEAFSYMAGNLPPGIAVVGSFHGKSGEAGVLLLAGIEEEISLASLRTLLAPVLTTCAALVDRADIERRRRQAEESLRRSLARLRGVVDTALDGVIIVDEKDRILEFNPAACRLFGYLREHVIGRSLTETIVPAAERETYKLGVENCLKSAKASTQGCRIELDAIRSGGTTFPVELSVSQVREGGQQLMTVYVRDISERHKVADELRAAMERAELANQEKGRFLATVSHELRTPLNALVGMSELLAETALNEAQREYVEAISVNARSLSELLSDVLDFAKIDEGRLELEHAPFDLCEVVESVALALRDQASRKGLELVLWIDPMLPAQVTGDRRAVRQILTNLVGNAIKFTSRGHVYLGAERGDAEGLRTHVRFRVSDSGPGIPLERQAHVFERFVRYIDPRQAEPEPGTGLGLSITRSLIELMGGRISLESTPGEGTTFRIDVEFASVVGAPSRYEPFAPEGARVLVVDDSAVATGALAAMIERLGFSVETEPDAYRALARIAEAPEHWMAVFADTAMPELDGVALLRVLSARCANPPPVVLVGAASVAGDVSRGEIRLAGKLSKPVRLSLLADLLASLTNVTIARPGVRKDTRDGAVAPARRILVAEDNRFNRLLAARILESAGHIVEVVGDGRAAVDAIRAGLYDLAFLDLQMPELDGFEAAAAIRDFEARFARTPVPIVALTAHAVAGFRDRCLAAGMNDYVTKPIQGRRALLEVVERWCDPRPALFLLDEATPVVDRLAAAVEQMGTHRLLSSRRTEDAGAAIHSDTVAALLIAAGRSSAAEVSVLEDLLRQARERVVPVVLIGRGPESVALSGEARPYVDLSLSVPEAAISLARALEQARDVLESARPLSRRPAPVSDNDPQVAADADSGARTGNGNGGNWSAAREAGLQSLVNRYLQEVGEEVEQVPQLASTGRMQDVRRIGHQLKGTGGGYGFARLSALGAELERAAEREDGDTVCAVARSVSEYLAEVEKGA
ncbi:MAG TPA: response regulator [Candidatus Limnocylindrales bacterium]|nr:response regulator [Candidatus Limnocylindrales bacterium]